MSDHACLQVYLHAQLKGLRAVREDVMDGGLLFTTKRPSIESTFKCYLFRLSGVGRTSLRVSVPAIRKETSGRLGGSIASFFTYYLHSPDQPLLSSL